MAASFDRSKIVGQRFFREERFDRAAVDADESTIAVAFSSEAPYLRWFGYEILDHRRDAVDLSRLNDGGAVLLNHDPDQHIGVVESAHVGSDRKARATVRFGKSPLAQEILGDVQNGIRRKMSVGYQVNDLVRDGELDGVPVFRVRSWTPFEISLVSVPADSSVGVGRSMKEETKMADEHLSRSVRRALARESKKVKLEGVPPEDRRTFLDHLEHLAGEGIEPLDDMSAEYVAYRKDEIRDWVDLYREQGRRVSDERRSSVYLIDIPNLAERALEDETVTVAAFRREAKKMIEATYPNDDTRIRTGALELDRLDPFHQVPGMSSAYGSGARVTERYGNLQAFKGADAERRAYTCGMFFRSLVGDTKARSWCQENGILQSRVMTEGVFTAGGALVPDMVSNEVINNVEQYGIFRRFARIWPMTSASLAVPVSGQGLSLTAVAETVATSTSDLALQQITLNAKEFAGGTRVSKSLLEDSAVALGDFLVREFGRALGQIEDQCGFTADGTSPYGGMQGLVYKLENDATHAGSTKDAASGHDTFAEIDVADLTSLMAIIPEYARAGAAWYVSASAKDAILTRLVASGGGNNTETLRQGTGESFLGYPVRTSQVLASDSGATYNGTAVVLFGNLALASAFGDRRALDVVIDMSRFVEYRQVYFQVTERFDVNNHMVGSTATVCGPIAGLLGTT